MSLTNQWDMQETSGSVAVDSVGKSGVGTYPEPLRELHFDGTGGYVLATPPVVSYPFTMMCDIDCDNTNNMVAMALNSGGSVYYAIRTNSGKLSVMRRNPTHQNHDSTKVPVAGEANKIAVVFRDETSLDIYINGNLDTAFSGLSSVALPSFTDFHLGRSSSALLVGNIHDARILGFAPTAQQLADNYADPAHNLTDTLAWYKGEEQLGVAGGIDVVYDSGPNANHGVATSGVATGGVTTVLTAGYSLANALGFTAGSTAQGLVVPRRGTALLDASGSPLEFPGPNTLVTAGNNGTLDGSASFLPDGGPGGSLVNAVAATGASNTQVILASDVTLLDSEDWSTAFCVKQNGNTNKGMVYGDRTTTVDYFWMRTLSRVQFNAGTTINYTQDAGVWTQALDFIHVAQSYEAATTTLRTYVNAVLINTTVGSFGLTINTLGAGFTSKNEALNGWLAYFHIYDNPLSQSDAAALVALSSDVVETPEIPRPSESILPNISPLLTGTGMSVPVRR